MVMLPMTGLAQGNGLQKGADDENRTLLENLQKEHKDPARRNELVTKIMKNKRAQKDDNIGVFVNGVPVDFEDQKSAGVFPIIKEGRTMIPVRAITQSVGGSVYWDSSAQTVTIIKDARTIILKLGSNEVVVKDTLANTEMTINLDVPAFIHESRTFVPLRFIAEVLKKKVEWNEIRAVIIEDKDEEEEEKDRPAYHFTTQLYEAETAVQNGVYATTVNAVYSGMGYVTGFDQLNDSVTFTVTDIVYAGEYKLYIRYANPAETYKTLSMAVNEAEFKQLRFSGSEAVEDDEHTWREKAVVVTFAAGTNTVALKKGEADTGSMDLDAISVKAYRMNR